MPKVTDVDEYAKEINAINSDMRLITDVWEQRFVINKCINFSRDRYWDPAKFFQRICQFVEWNAFWIVEYNRGPIPNEYKELYISQNGEWDHSGGFTKAHNDLGMRWAAWMERDMEASITLSDSPDVSGKYKDGGKIVGDIGKCTSFAFFMGITNRATLTLGDAWISVFDDKEYIWQVGCEPGTTIRQLFTGLNLAKPTT